MIALDHIAVWSDNLYRTTLELSRQTGIGVADGGWFPALGLGQKVLSLGGGVYIEVESIVDHQMIVKREPMALELERQTAQGDCFAGLCFRTDSLDELREFARHRGIEVSGNIRGGKEPSVLAQQRSSGLEHAPDFWNSWRLGKPNIYYVPDLTHQSSNLPVQPGTGDVAGAGVVSIEIGGPEQALREWFGDALDPDTFGVEIQYNGKADGLYSVTFESSAGLQTIAMNPINLPEPATV